ncbi:SDR family NAD(P)-dependent oxidoreductase [Microbacterium sp. A93]|uniref:SDR family NAD(P)-dependent oxidoreductase n=1 Tax=Microbacterium sp. A93 TaxID=3450716 RepID=UPI003F43131C
MSEQLQGIRAIVTGAGRGIGRAVAIRLAEHGADVAVVDINLESGKDIPGEADAPTTEAIEALGRRAIGIQADLTDPAAASRIVAKVVDAWGGLDVVANIAGGAITPFARSNASTIPIEDIRHIFDVNLMSAIYMCQAAVPALRESSRAAIVNTTSLSASVAHPGGMLAGYGMSKIALGYYTRALAEEIGPDGIRVNAVAPGYTMTGRVRASSVDTGFAEKAEDVALRRLATPEDIADGVVFLASPGSSYVTGHTLSIDGQTRVR